MGSVGRRVGCLGAARAVCHGPVARGARPSGTGSQTASLHDAREGPEEDFHEPGPGSRRSSPGAPAGPDGIAPASRGEGRRPAPPKPAEQTEVRDEAWWRKRITAARADLQRNELFLEALQSRVNALSTDFAGRDDPMQRAQVSANRQRALAEMERVRADIDKLKKQIVEIEEEARVAGVPPGWLR
jgi:hypothetical protein